MNFCRIISVLLGAFALASGMNSRAASDVPLPSSLARIHWLGMNQVSADINSAQFMKIWNLPESKALEAQTLDKLARWLAGGATNAASAKIRPLLDDLVSSECFLGIYASPDSQHSSNNSLATENDLKAAQFCLAVHLTTSRGRLWQTNLAIALQKLTGVAPAATKHGWRLKQSSSSEYIGLDHNGEWTLIGVGRQVEDQLPEFISSVIHSTTSSATNYWVECDVNLSCIHKLYPLPTDSSEDGDLSVVGSIVSHLLSSITRVHLSTVGRNNEIITQGKLSLARPVFETNLPPWEIPTNFIRKSLIRFSAIRSMAPLLAKSSSWRKTGFTPPPDQAYSWTQSGMPFLSYFAFPLPGASNQLYQSTAHLLAAANSWLKTDSQGSLEWKTNMPGIAVKGAMIMDPFLKPASSGGRDYLVGGLYPLAFGDASLPPKVILRPMLETPDLVYYESELTGHVVEDELFVGQLMRIFFRKAQLPPHCAAIRWVKEVEPSLGGCATALILAKPGELSLKRISTLGFSAFELHVIADWLESPTFPKGLHTFTAPTK